MLAGPATELKPRSTGHAIGGWCLRLCPHWRDVPERVITIITGAMSKGCRIDSRRKKPNTYQLVRDPKLIRSYVDAYWRGVKPLPTCYPCGKARPINCVTQEIEVSLSLEQTFCRGENCLPVGKVHCNPNALCGPPFDLSEVIGKGLAPFLFLR